MRVIMEIPEEVLSARSADNNTWSSEAAVKYECTYAELEFRCVYADGHDDIISAWADSGKGRYDGTIMTEA